MPPLNESDGRKRVSHGKGVKHQPARYREIDPSVFVFLEQHRQPQPGVDRQTRHGRACRRVQNARASWRGP